MSIPATAREMAGWSRYSALSDAQRQDAVRSCREVTESIYPGLDFSEEIRTTEVQTLGDTVLLEGPGGLAAFAVCHYGPRSEAGADTCFIKFGAVRDSPSAEREYGRLLDACDALSVSGGHAEPACRSESCAPWGVSESGGAWVSDRDPGGQYASA
jgi:hypothetical protein